MSAIDRRNALRRAAHAVERGQYDVALPFLWSLVDRAHVLDDEFAGFLRLMARAFAGVGRGRAAAAAHLFLGDVDEARRASNAPTDLARCAVRAENLSEAARKFEEAGWLGHAAIQLERDGDDRGARVLWERLLGDVRLHRDPYTAGLTRFNLGRACHRLGDTGAGRRALVDSVHQLEAAADGFEAQGRRERAFDCFQVILTLGREGAFENLAEGYLNSIRILREDKLRYYVLQYYEDFQKLALDRGELHAAATLFREAADFARREGLPYETYYRMRGAEVHEMAADRTLEEGGSVELAENALMAAIDAWNQLGVFSRVSTLYGRLATLPLRERRRARYRRLEGRLRDVPDESAPITPFPEYLRMDTAYPEIWYLDLVEWEQGGDAAETMNEVLLDPKWQDYTRRLALLCVLHQLSWPDGAPSPDRLGGLAIRLGRVGIYPSLAPLEHMFGHEEGSVRASCMRAAQELFFKRSFGLVMDGLRDPAPEVRREALLAVQKLHFVHAFDPLSRIYRSSPDEKVRHAALGSIGRIPRIEAVEMLIDVLRHGDAEERALSIQLLARADQPETTEVLRRAADGETGAVRNALDRAIRTRVS